MSSCTIAETKDNLSAILAALADGTERERIIKNRGVPIAAIIPYGNRTSAARQFGYAKEGGKPIDWNAFDAMDSKIAEEFGA